MFYTNSVLGVTNSPLPWVHNLVSNAAAQGVALTAGSFVARVCIFQASNTATAFPGVIDPIGSNVLRLQMNKVCALTACRAEVFLMHSIPDGLGGLGGGPGPVPPPAAPGVNLRTAVTFAALGKSGISTVPNSNITGNIGVSPAAASTITGFSLVLDGSGVFSTSAQVTGQIFAADYAAPTPANMTQAVLDMQAAYTDASGRPVDVSELGGGNIGGLTLPPGVYKWTTVLNIAGADLTLNGAGVYIFITTQGMTLANARSITLAGGATAANVFWVIAGVAAIGTTAHLEGTVLGQTSITVATNASVNGKLLAQTAVTLDQNVITIA